MNDSLTTGDVARLCDIPYTTVLSWVKAGKITSRRTPGGHFLIKRNDLLQFLLQYNFPLPSEFHQWRQWRLLIISEQPSLVEMIQQALVETNLSYEFAVAEDGFDAAFKLLELAPDLVILDAKAKGFDAIKVCQRVKLSPKTMHLPIVSITSKEQENKLLQAGSDACLISPIDCCELKQQIHSLLNPKNVLSSESQ